MRYFLATTLVTLTTGSVFSGEPTNSKNRVGALSCQIEGSETDCNRLGGSLHEGIRAALGHYEQQADRPSATALQRVRFTETAISLWCFGFATRDKVMPKARTMAKLARRQERQLSAGQSHLIFGISVA